MLLRSTLSSLTTKQQEVLVELFELFIAKREEKAALFAAVQEYGIEGVLEEFELSENQLRWYRHKDWDHQMTRKRAAEIANDKRLPGLIAIDWIAPLFRQWLRWRDSGRPSARSKSELGAKSGALFAVLAVDPTTATISSVRRAWISAVLRCHPDKTGHLESAEQEARERQFRAVQEAWEELRKPGSVDKHCKVCANSPSYDADS